MSTISMKNDIETSVTVEDNTVPKTTLNNKKKMIIAAATVLTFCLFIFGYFGYIIYQNTIETKKITTFIENYDSNVSDNELLEFYCQYSKIPTVVEFGKEHGISSKADVYLRGRDIFTVSDSNDVLALRILVLVLGISVNSKNTEDYSWAPIHYAVYSSKIPIIEELIKLGANLEQRDDESLSTPIFWSLENEEVLGILIKADCKVNVSDINGNTPLHMTENKEVVQRLLAAGANEEAKNRKNETPRDLVQIGSEIHSLLV